LTREQGKNDKLGDRLRGAGLSIVEVPCVAQVRDPRGEEELEALLRAEPPFCWAVVTSPEAAAALSDAVERCGTVPLSLPLSLPRVATVGAASARKLRHVTSAFSPSKATAATLADELPGEIGDSVLFPASKLAARTLESRLEERGFIVTRVDAYTTVPAPPWDDGLRDTARTADVVAFGSPSAVDVWRRRIGTDGPRPVCIGETTALACDDAGFRPKATFPAKPGLPGWADEIIQAAAANVNDDR